jgi:hypothetical protein
MERLVNSQKGHLEQLYSLKNVIRKLVSEYIINQGSCVRGNYTRWIESG